MLKDEKKEKIPFFKRFPWYVILPVILTVFIYFQPNYKIDCNYMSDLCKLYKRPNLFSEMKKTKEFNISDIAFWKIKEYKTFGIPQKTKYYLYFSFYNTGYFSLKQFSTDTREDAKQIYIRLKHRHDYVSETHNKLASKALFSFFALIAAIILTYKYGIKRV